MFWLGVTLLLSSFLTITYSQTSCYPIQYSPYSGYKDKHAMIFYVEQFQDLADQIACQLESLEIDYSREVLLKPNDIKLYEVCNNSDFLNHTSTLHITVTITMALKIEEMCRNDVVLLHMKQIDKKWLGHVITPRTDMIIPLVSEDGEPMFDSLMILMETVAMAWGPLYFTPDKSKYKSLKLIEKAVKSKLVLVPSLAVCMVFLVGVVGVISFFAKRKKQKAEEKSLQKRKSFLLAEWGDENFQGTPMWNIEGEPLLAPIDIVGNPNEALLQLPRDPRPTRGSNEVILSETE
ncbi:hypothetical protein RB195_020953 [Necator americanus]|uniref:Uncharacterized protein n=1 Tax=Necator americanus TaxID=51031 RepID=A0ABR1CP19_NECAM